MSKKLSHKRKNSTKQRTVKGQAVKDIKSAPKSSQKGSFWRFWVYPAAALLAFLVYAQTLSYGTVNFDDRTIIEEVLADISGTGEIFKSFSHSYANFYRPLQNFTFVIDRELSGNSYIGYHLTNLILHCLSVCSVILMLRVLGSGDKKSFFAGLLFAVHPLFAHAVVWIPSRGDLLLCLFAILSFVTFLKYFENREIKYFILHGVFIFFAALSKETALIIPAVSIFYLILKDRSRLKSLRILYFAVVWAAVGIIWYLLRSSAETGTPHERSFGVEAFLKNLPAAAEIAGKFFLPLHLNVMPTFHTLSVVSGIVFLGGLLFFVIKSRGNMMTGLFGLGWYFLFLLPTLVFRLQQAGDFFDYLEHRAYLPSAGILIALSAIIPEKVFERSKKTAYGIALAAAVVLSLITVLRSTDYSSPMNYWKAAIEGNPGRAFFYTNLAKIYLQKNMPEEAEATYKKSIELAPKYSMPYDGLAGIYFSRREFEKAMNLMETAISKGNATVEIYNNFGGLANTMGEYRKTIEVTKESLSKFGNNPLALSNIAKAYSNTGRLDSAFYYAGKISDRRMGKELETSLYLGAAGNAFEKGLFQRCIEFAAKAADINPRHSYPYVLMGSANASMNNFNEAVRFWKKALDIEPGLENIRKQLYTYYMNVEKNPQEAAKYRK